MKPLLVTSTILTFVFAIVSFVVPAAYVWIPVAGLTLCVVTALIAGLVLRSKGEA